MHAVWGTGLLSLTKMVIVVDEWVDVHDYGEVAWQVGANTDPGPRRRAGAAARSTSSTTPRRCSRSAASSGWTRPRTWPGEGYPREWPEVARMSDEVRAPGRRALGLARDRAPVRARRRARGAPGAPRMAPLVAVLGASRFLGRLAIPLFAAEGWRVRALDRRQAAIAGMLGVERDWADPLDERSLTRATTDCACVLDLSSSESGADAVAATEAALLAGGAGPRHPRRAAGHADRRRPAAIRRASRSCAARP